MYSGPFLQVLKAVIHMSACRFRPDAAVPPWVGYNEEETIQQQILALSAVRHNSSHTSGETGSFLLAEPVHCDPRTKETSYETRPLVSSSTLTWSTCIL